MDTLTKSCSPTIVITANGEVQTHEEATVYVKELEIFLTMKVLENTPAVLSLGKLCDENGYSYEWINGQKPHLIKDGIRIHLQYGELRSDCGSRLVKFVLWSHSSTSRTPSKTGAIIPHHLPHPHLLHQPVVLSESQTREREDLWLTVRFLSSTFVKFTCWTNRTGKPLLTNPSQKSQNK